MVETKMPVPGLQHRDTGDELRHSFPTISDGDVQVDEPITAAVLRAIQAGRVELAGQFARWAASEVRRANPTAKHRDVA